MRIALLLRGHHFLWRDRFGFPLDGRRYIDSLKRLILDPLRQNHTVDLFLATYESSILQDIVAALSPRALALPDLSSSNQASTFINGLELIEKEKSSYDRIVCTRFDLAYRKSIEHWDVWHSRRGIFFPWREYEEPWRIEHRVGDAIHLVDRPYLDHFKSALTVLKFQPVGHLHRLYDGLLPLTSDLHFIESGYYDSNTLYGNRECRNPLYRIANRPRLPVTQPYKFSATPRPLTWSENLHWKVATLFLRPTAFLARLFFRVFLPSTDTRAR